MSADVAPILNDVFRAVGDFLSLIVPTTTKVIRKLDNRVAMPKGDFVAMTLITLNRLQGNEHEYDDSGLPVDSTQTINAFYQLGMQLDFYGRNSGNQAAAAATLFRDERGSDALKPACAPLWADDATMMELETGEAQYLERWMLMVYLQWNPAVTLPQEFADTFEVVLKNVDVEFPP